MKNFLIKTFLFLFLGFFLSWGYFYTPQSFFSFDNRLRDFLFVIRGELPKDNRVIIVDIDEKSLKEYGQWPWQRDVFAQLLYSLTDYGAGIIGLDIVFAEEDRSSPHRFVKEYPELKNRLVNYDKELANCFAQTPVVGGYIFTFEPTDNENEPSVPAVFIEKGMKDNPYILQPKGAILNIDILQNSLYSSGFFNNTPDEGGMIRSIPLVMKYNDMIYPSLALEMLRIYSGANKVMVTGDNSGIGSIDFGEFHIPTDKSGRLMVNFRGPSKHFNYISAVDVIQGKVDKKEIENKFVLVGTSAVGLFDLRSIPLDSVFAGVEVHANAIDNILSGDFLQKPSQVLLYDLAIIWMVIVLFGVAFSVVKSWFIIPIAIASLYGMFELYFYMLFSEGLVLNILFPLLAFLFTLIASVGIDYILEARQKEQAKRMLGKKVSPAVMNYLLEHSTEELVASREVETTIFFSDVRSFTTISEKIGAPDKLIQMLNDYMTPMVDNIVNHKGTIDKFIGDAIMAYWNAPVSVKNHPDEAVKSAIEQIEMLKEINELINPKYEVDIAIGIGIHTGIVTAGDMGSKGRSDYTIIGDNVNLASRMEGLTKQYGAQILISKATHDLLKGKYKIRPADLVEVKGKSEAVEIFEVLCNNKIVTDEEMELYEKATYLFRDAKVQEAYEIYTRLQSISPCILYEFYMHRCEKFLNDPELEFTPILKMTTK